MFTNILFLEPVVLLMFGVFVILSVSGFIGNLNINSGDSSVNINGTDVKTIFIDEVEEDIDPLKALSLNIFNPVGDIKITTNTEKKLHLVKRLYVSESVTEMEKSELKSIFKEKVLFFDGNVIRLQVPKLATMSVLSVRVDLEICIPKDFNVIQDPGVNDLSVQDLDGSLDVSHNVGNIALMNVAGTTKIKSNSSSVIAENLSDLAYLVVNAGNIAVKSVKVSSSESVINVNAGNIDLDIDEIHKLCECNVEAGAGEIFITINKNANLSLKAISNIGNVDIGSGIIVVSEEKRFMGTSIMAKVNNPEGSLLINSNTGNINIKLR